MPPASAQSRSFAIAFFAERFGFGPQEFFDLGEEEIFGLAAATVLAAPTMLLGFIDAEAEQPAADPAPAPEPQVPGEVGAHLEYARTLLATGEREQAAEKRDDAFPLPRLSLSVEVRLARIGLLTSWQS